MTNQVTDNPEDKQPADDTKRDARFNARLDELLPPPASGYEMSKSIVAQRALRILGHGGSSQSRQALTEEQRHILAQFNPLELKQFQRVCSLMSDPDGQDMHHRQWIDRTLLGADPEGASALCWMPTQEALLEDIAQINRSRQAALTMLLTLLDPELMRLVNELEPEKYSTSEFSKHRGFAIAVFGNKTLVDINLGSVYEQCSCVLRLNIARYKAPHVSCPEQAEACASRHTEHVFKHLINDIEKRTQIQAPKADPLIVQLLKASTFNRAAYNINQLIKQTKEACSSLAPLTEFLTSKGFQFKPSLNEAGENQRLLALFDLENPEANVRWRTLNEEQLLRMRTRAREVWKLLMLESLVNIGDGGGVEVEIARRTYSYFLTLIMAWCYCTKVEFRANLRYSKVRDLVSGEKHCTAPSIPELRFHVTQVKMLSQVQLFNGSGTEALKQLSKHRLFQYDCELQLIKKLQSLSLAQLDKLHPERFYFMDDIGQAD